MCLHYRAARTARLRSGQRSRGCMCRRREHRLRSHCLDIKHDRTALDATWPPPFRPLRMEPKTIAPDMDAPSGANNNVELALRIGIQAGCSARDLGCQTTWLADAFPQCTTKTKVSACPSDTFTGSHFLNLAVAAEKAHEQAHEETEPCGVAWIIEVLLQGLSLPPLE